MAQFDESKIITALHPEKAEVGKEYWVSDKLIDLKDMVEIEGAVFKLTAIIGNSDFPFVIDSPEETVFQFLYPYEEPPEQRMTNLQFIEWLAKGNGVYKNQGGYVHSSYVEIEELLDEEVDETYLIRPFGQTEWIEPTVDIYVRDCKGGKE